MTSRDRPETVERSDSARTFQAARNAADRRTFAVFQGCRERGNALFERGEQIAMAVRSAELIDLRRQHDEIVVEPRQRIVGRDVGDDAAKRADRVFELLHHAAVAAAAHDRIDLAAEIADCLVESGKLFRRFQRSQCVVDFIEGAFDVRQRLAIAAALPDVVNAARQRANLVFDRFDRAARQRFGDDVTNTGKFAAECGDRLLHPIGALQQFDLARDLEQVPFEAGEIRCDGCGVVIAGATGGELRGGITRGDPPSSCWRAAISAIANSSEAGSSDGDGL